MIVSAFLTVCFLHLPCGDGKDEHELPFKFESFDACGEFKERNEAGLAHAPDLHFVFRCVAEEGT